MPWADPEKTRAYQREAMRKRRADPVYREKMLARRREIYAANPEHFRAASRDYKASNREKVRAYIRDYHATRYKNDAEFRQARIDAAHTRKHAKRGVTTERVSRAAIILRDGSRCHICKKKCKLSEIHLDHLVPLSKGGTHCAENLAVACAACNMARGAGRISAQLRLVA